MERLIKLAIMSSDYAEAFVAGLMYAVREYEDGEMMEYQYGYIKHATEHYDWETKADKVELVEYSTITGTEETIRSK